MEGLGEGLRPLMGMGIPQEDQQSHLSWTRELSETESPSRAYARWTEAPYTYVADVHLGLHMGPTTTRAKAIPTFVA